MGNPFNIGPFNCCSCPEPPDFDSEVDDPMATYVHMCGCPTVEVVCVSLSKDAELLGFSEYIASSPPKKFKSQDLSGSRTAPSRCCNNDPTSYSETNSGTRHWDDLSGAFSPPDSTASRESFRDEVSAGTSSLPNNTIRDLRWASGYNSFCQTKTESSNQSTWYSSVVVFQTCLCDCMTGFQKATLSSEDIESDALTRAVEVTGASCSSIDELRTNAFAWTYRTVTYSATASNLVIGVAYEGCVRLRRRKAYSGTTPIDPDTGVTEVIAWEDVEPDTIASFTPTETSEEVATDEALPIEKGYEYEAVSAHVWPVSVGCDCPTSYIAP